MSEHVRTNASYTHTEAKSAGQKLEEYAHPTKPEEGLG